MVEIADDADSSVEIRARFLVEDAEGDMVYEPITVIVKEPDYKKQLIAGVEA